MKTMSAFSCISVTGLSFLLYTGTAQAIPWTSLELSSTNIHVGDTFDVNVYANGVTDVDPSWGPDEILSFGFDLSYTASEFTYNGATVGLGFNDDSSSLPDTDVAGSAFPGISGTGIFLASLSFTSLQVGGFTLGIASDLTDPNEGLNSWLYGPIDMTGGIGVDVSNAAAPVPEPATILLVGAGLAGLAGARRRFKK